MRSRVEKERQCWKFIPPLVLLVLGLVLSLTQGLERWDRFVYDYLSISVSRPPSDHIVIIAIEEESLATYGHRPWPRSVHADLIDKLSLGGAKAIGFDIVIAEPDENAPEDDLQLAEAVSRSGRVIMPVLGELNPVENKLTLTKPLPDITEVAAGLGHVDLELDSDGMMRRVFLMAGIGRPTWEAMSLAMLRLTTSSVIEELPGKRNEHLQSASADSWVRDYEILLPLQVIQDIFSVFPMQLL